MRLIVSLIALVMLTAPAAAHAPVKPNPNHEEMLESDDPQLERNKRLAYDTWRIVVEARQMDRADEFIHQDYIQHNPNAVTGLEGMKKYFRKLGDPQPVKDRVQRPIVSIVAEGNYVVMTFVDEREDPETGETYTTTWFDMFRIEDGKIAEHWDSARR